MFRSVQLNINNPHFLIMQGRITKVLNMKPPEVDELWASDTIKKLYLIDTCIVKFVNAWHK